MFLVAANTRQAIVGQKEWLTTGSSGIQVQFLFSEDWNGLSKFAVFRNAEIEESVIPIALPSSNLTELPAENCAAEYVDEKVYVGVYGTDGLGHIIIPTIWVSLGVLKEGAAYEGMDPPQPTPDMWAQILAIAQNAGAENAEAAEKAEAGAKEAASTAQAAAAEVKNLSVDADTLAAGEPATVEKTVDAGTGAVKLKFGIPQGPKGDPLTYEDLTEEQKAELVQGPIREAQTSAVAAVGSARTTAVNAVNQAGTTQTGAVNQAGVNQVAAVNQAGETQAQAVEDKGAEVLDSIPPDYSDLAAEVDDLNRQLNDETTGLDTKAPVILETVSGAIASFDDGADGMPVKKLLANIEPVQGLHGYDHPWPAGGNVNLINPDTVTANSWINIDTGAVESGHSDYVVSDYIPVIEGQQYVKSGYGSTNRSYFYTADKTPVSRWSSNAITIPSGVSYARITVAVTDLNTSAMVEAGSTASTYSPYSNICPISGWTGANIHGTAVNIFGGALLRDGIKAAIPAATIDDQAETIEFTSRADIVKPFTSEARLTNRFKTNTQYTFLLTCVKTSGNNTATNMRIYYTDGSYTNITPLNSATTKQTTVTVSVAGKTVSNLTKTNAAGWTAVYYDESGIFEGVLTADDFVPYTGTTLPINWQTEAGTIYGGTVTLNEDGSADVVSDTVLADLSELGFSWNNSTQTFRTAAKSDIVKPNTSDTIADILCSAFKVVAANFVATTDLSIGVNNAGNVIVKWTEYSNNLSGFLAAVAGFKLLYHVVTPQHYHFGNIGQLYTFLGTNNVWIDTGAITECDYPADTKLYIDGKIAEMQATILENIGG